MSYLALSASFEYLQMYVKGLSPLLICNSFSAGIDFRIWRLKRRQHLTSTVGHRPEKVSILPSDLSYTTL